MSRRKIEWLHSTPVIVAASTTVKFTANQIANQIANVTANQTAQIIPSSSMFHLYF